MRVRNFVICENHRANWPVRVKGFSQPELKRGGSGRGPPDRVAYLRDFSSIDEYHEVDADIINAGKQTITELRRTSYCSYADSFGVIRGGHINLSVLGAMEVAENGNLANLMVSGKMIKEPGGAMDLVAGVKKIIVLMDHVAKDGSAKFRKACTLPLTSTKLVDILVTNLAVFDRADRHSPFVLRAPAPGVTAELVCSLTEADYEEGLAPRQAA